MSFDTFVTVANWVTGFLLAFTFVFLFLSTKYLRRRVAKLERALNAIVPEPEPPQNVKVVRDGNAIPVELVHAGFEAHGDHIWRCVTPWGGWTPGNRPPELSADVIPGHTRIVFEGDDE